MKYSNISPKFTSEFFALVNQANKIVITSHESPDEDSIASVLSIYDIISTRHPEKEIRIIYSSDPVTKYKIFKNYDKIEFVADMADHLEGTDLLIMVDGGNYSRFSHKPEVLKLVPKTICFDHHCSPADKFTLSLVTPQYPACVEIIYRSFVNDIEIDKSLAEIFLLGILGDTGNFTYLKANQTETLSIAQKLIEIGEIEIQDFQSRYRDISKKIFNAIQEFIRNTQYLSIADWPDFQYSYISREYMQDNNLTDHDVSTASHLYSSEFIRTIEGNTWGFVITPNSNGEINISCRSLPGSVNVRVFMEKQQIGGGHDRASGGTFKNSDKILTVDDCIEKTLSWMRLNKQVLG